MEYSSRDKLVKSFRNELEVRHIGMTENFLDSQKAIVFVKQEVIEDGPSLRLFVSITQYAVDIYIYDFLVNIEPTQKLLLHDLIHEVNYQLKFCKFVMMEGEIYIVHSLLNHDDNIHAEDIFEVIGLMLASVKENFPLFINTLYGK